MFTLGAVDGSESKSLPFWFVIVTLSTASNSSAIQATFVNIFLLLESGFAVTSHSISIVSDFRFPSVYASKFVVLLALLVIVTWFDVSL